MSFLFQSFVANFQAEKVDTVVEVKPILPTLAQNQNNGYKYQIYFCQCEREKKNAICSAFCKMSECKKIIKYKSSASLTEQTYKWVSSLQRFCFMY